MNKLSIFIKLTMLTFIVSICVQCNKQNSTKASTITNDSSFANSAQFSADSAYKFVAEQCAFGARVPGSEAHKKCGDYLQTYLSKYGKVYVQTPELVAFNGNKFKARNIICAINPDSARRILLVAHWDSRPWADADKNASNHTKPVMGANDGASGVGVLMELARLFYINPPKVGIDILLVDMEDMGNEDIEESWGLGTQYWVNNKHVMGYRPMFGILLDMVGAADAKFRHEVYSKYFAPQILDLVWDTAIKSGYSKYFVNNISGGVTDDHLFINRDGIPTIDIIDSNDKESGSGFFPHWHTTTDVIDNISPETLEAVGQTIANVVYAF